MSTSRKETGPGVIGAAKERARVYVGRHPRLFFGVYGARQGYGDLLVDRKTDLVVEGFPRSGNTFAVFAFREAQEREVRIAHHMHAPAQIVRAARLGVPALVLLRDPVDAALSLMLRDPRYTAEGALRYYVSFYEAVAGYRDHFVLGAFEEVTRDYGPVIERVNGRFGTSFGVFGHDEKNVEKVFASIEASHRARRGSVLVEEQIARPSASKANLKAALKKEVESLDLGPLVERARAAHGRLSETSAKDRSAALTGGVPRRRRG